MPKTPTPQDIDVPNVSGARPIVGFDVSPLARGGQALAHGIETLGKGISGGAEDILKAQTEKQRLSVENGLMGLSTEYVKNRNQYSVSNDPADLDRWQAANKAAEEKFNTTTPPPNTPLGAHAQAKKGLVSEEENLRIAERGKTIATSQAHADVMADIEGIAADTRYDPSGKPDLASGQRLQSLYSKIDSHSKAGLITPEKAETYRQHAITRLVQAEIGAGTAAIAAETDPEKRLQIATELKAMIGRPLRGMGNPETASQPSQPNGGAARLVSQAETGDPTLGPKALGNISRDSKGTKSYGFTGLNSGSGSAAEFTRQYGAQFGLRGQPGTPGFDAQWKAAAQDQTEAFRDAQLKFFNEKNIAPVVGDLTKIGIPENIASDPRVVTYFADRHVQMGTLGLQNAAGAWTAANGNVETFLRNMTQGDAANLNQYFPSAIASGVYGPEGHATRLRTRLSGALELTAPGMERFTHPGARVAQIALTPEQVNHANTMIETAVNAGRIDDERKARQDAAKAKQQTEAVKDEYFKDAHSDNSTKSRDYPTDPRLEGNSEAKTAIEGFYNRANKPDPISRISEPTTMSFVDRMRKPEGDPQKLTNRDEITDAYLARHLTKADYEWTLKQFNDARTPDGKSYHQMRADFVKRVVEPQIMKSDIATGLNNTKVGQRAYEFEQEMDAKKEIMIKAGKNPMEMFDKNSPDYMGKEEVLKDLRRTAQRDLDDMLKDEAEAANKPSKPSAAPSVDPTAAKSLPELQAMVRANPGLRERAIAIAAERGWVAIRPKTAPSQMPTVPTGQ